MKKCTVCKVNKDENLFHFRNKSKGIRKGQCADCMNKKQKEKNHERYLKDKEGYVRRGNNLRERNRDWLYEYLSNKVCSICLYDDSRALQFDHRDAGDKTKGISKMVHECYSIEKIKKEIKKCDILCANCHAIRTSQQMGWHYEKR